jgi:hypothetical protein
MKPKPDHLSDIAAEKRINLLAARADEIRQALRQRQVHLLADNTHSIFTQNTAESGVFRLGFWDKEIEISYPAFEMVDPAHNQPLNPGQQALILYYFFTSNGAQLANEWISFTNLQDGLFYSQAFQGYTGRELAKVFQNDLARFERAATQLNGIPYSLGDAAFEFSVLPKVHLLVVAWQGDEDFPPNYQILFDASVNNFLPTDACAIAGSMLTRRLINSSR